MDFRRYLLLLLACLLTWGCRRDPYMDAYFDMLNAEKRALEDRIYELEYDYEQKVKELEACQKQQGKKSETTRKAPRRDEDKTEKYEPSLPDGFPKIEIPSGAKNQAGEKSTAVTRSNVALASYIGPAPPDPSGEGPPVPPPALWEQRASATVATAGYQEARGARASAVSPSRQPPDPDRVEHIYLNARTTHGDDFDQQPGDDGLSVLIEPRNADGQFVGKAGKVSLVLLDPALQGAAARVARWDFEPEVAAGVLRTKTLDRGLHFRVPWPNRPPEHERLHLFARYVTDDGRFLEAHREITIHLTDSGSQEWTARTAASSTKPAPEPVTPAMHTEPAEAAAPTALHASSEAPASSSPRTAAARGRFWKPSRQ